MNDAPDTDAADTPAEPSAEAKDDRADGVAGGPDAADAPPAASDEGAADSGSGGADEGDISGVDEGDSSGVDEGGSSGTDEGGSSGTDEGGGEAADETPSHKEDGAKKPERPTLVIRYGRMRFLGRFRYSLDRWRRGQRAVIKSDRGIEIGTIICRWVDDGRDADLRVKGEVLRLVTHSDEVDERHLEKDADREFAFCKECIAAHNLPMKLVAVEHLFGGDRIIFYFVAEKRVDFRALVRDLAREFQTRIEMRQIGVRDEARLLGDFERCGRPLCCRAFIKDLEPVSMKMAKVQKATLDPSKISGRCGRLMCCLRFEHATYRELQKNLPRKNKEVGTAVGRGKVIGTDVVTQTVTVLLESGTRVVVPVETLVPPDEAPAPGKAAAGADEGAREQPTRDQKDRNRGGEKDGDKAADKAADKDAEKGADKGDAETSGSPKDESGKKRGRRKRRRSKGKRRGKKSGEGGNAANAGNRSNAKG